MTHLDVPVRHLVNLVTMQLPKDNSSNPFYYDRQATAPFGVPKRCAFVITDVFVNPEITSYAAGQFYLVLVTVDGGRSITIGGLVVPAPGVPTPGTKGVVARNTTYSSGPVEVQLLGYFVKNASGLGVGQPFVP